MIKAIEILKSKGFYPVSDLNYCTDNGIEYYIGYRGSKAGVCALITDENVYMIDKDSLREMSYTAKVRGINEVHLFTNYGLEIHSKHENAQTVEFTSIQKVVNTTTTDSHQIAFFDKWLEVRSSKLKTNTHEN